ncbi:hypothetical protein KUL42_34430 [Alteromonas sp. KUL42]|uniref:FAD/NAD(P)-binding protein n=1 Tax=Alteromonas sp. KUL42 TaxID=2480797 RepID=UPI0010FFB98C|nr:FAD/NAD(P)-binding protein [Alteromonas sp. KUL42]GEA08682.1 hypothetical protein KUL42_34430 [Alteromonas sp. KUL42]
MDQIRIAVIGGGAGAREFVIRLGDSFPDSVVLSLDVFSAEHTFGHGVAWTPEETPVLANMRAETLGPDYHEFEIIQEILEKTGDKEAGAEYPSRNAMSRALDERWKSNNPSTRPNIAVNIISGNVVELTKLEDNTVTVKYTENNVGAKQTCNGYQFVVLALGNIKSKKPDIFKSFSGYIDGWDIESIRRIKSNEKVLIRGSSLSSIDATMRMLHHTGNGVSQESRWQPNNILWYSRSGKLPFVRPKQLKLGSYFVDYPYLTNLINELESKKQSLTLEDVQSLLLSELRVQEFKKKGRFYECPKGLTSIQNLVEDDMQTVLGRDHDDIEQDGFDVKPQQVMLQESIDLADAYSLWFSVAKLLDEYTIPLVWNALDLKNKELFLTKYRRIFDKFWAPIPKVNGERLLRWLKEGMVHSVEYPDEDSLILKEGKIYLSEDIENESLSSTLEYTGNGFSYLINCGGISSNPFQMDNALVEKMHEKSQISPYFIGEQAYGIKLNWYTGAVWNQNEEEHGWLYTLTGSLTTGAHRFTNSYLAVSISAQRTVNDILRKL